MRWTGDLIQNLIVGFLFAAVLALGFFFLSERKAGLTWLTFWLAWCLLGAWATINISAHVVLEPRDEGVLRPGREPRPERAPQIPANAIAVLFAGGTAWTTGNGFTVLRLANKPMLSISRHGTDLMVNAEVFSPDGNIIAEIKNNEFALNPNNYFRKVRPDRHTLKILDQKNIEVLNVNFLNPSTISIEGIFSNDGHAVRATTEALLFGKGNRLRVGGMQVGEGSTAYSF